MTKKDKEDKADEQRPEDINDLLAKIAVATTLDNSTATKEPASNIELTNKVVDTLFNMVRRKMLGILTKRQITGIKKLYLVNDIVFSNKPSVLTRIIDNEIDLSVSEGGKGREQLVSLTKTEDPLEATGSRFKRYFQ